MFHPNVTCYKQTDTQVKHRPSSGLCKTDKYKFTKLYTLTVSAAGGQIKWSKQNVSSSFTGNTCVYYQENMRPLHQVWLYTVTVLLFS